MVRFDYLVEVLLSSAEAGGLVNLAPSAQVDVNFGGRMPCATTADSELEVVHAYRLSSGWWWAHLDCRPDTDWIS